VLIRDRDRLEIGRGLLQRNALADAPYDGEKMQRAGLREIRRLGNGSPRVDLTRGEREAGGHHADDLVIAPVECHPPADDLRILAEMVTPGAIAQDENAMVRRHAVSADERAAQARRDAERVEEISGDGRDVRVERLRAR